MLLTHKRMWYCNGESEQESKIKPENKMTKGVLSSKCLLRSKFTRKQLEIAGFGTNDKNTTSKQSSINLPAAVQKHKENTITDLKWSGFYISWLCIYTGIALLHL